MVDFSSAVGAYAKTASDLSGAPSLEAPTSTGTSFASFLKDAAVNAIDVNTNAEQLTAQAALGKADLTEVVTAVTSAEVTLQSVVAVRDKVISAYQEIMRMSI